MFQRVGRLRGHAWEQMELPWHARRGLLFSLCNTGPVFQRHQVITMHDASFKAVPESYSLPFRQWYGVLLPMLGLTCRRVLTVSQFAKKELEKRLHIRASKIHVVPHGGNHLQRFEPQPRFPDELPRRFVLGVGSLTYNRNFHGVERALEMLGDSDLVLVVAGQKNPAIFGAAVPELTRRTHFLGHVDSAYLPDLYSRAFCLVIPSFYDSFGLPALEAMGCGCPVIASRTAALPEVCGSAALYCDPRRPDDIADRLRQLRDESGLRERLQREGQSRAQTFQWQRCARETWDVIAPLVA
jgi:glycosyltransferase involved in cell wall biosynthesis